MLLYELLTGRKPFEFRDARLSEMERIICSQTPPSPSEVCDVRGASPVDVARIEAASEARETTPARMRREIGGDLDNIVMKALRKEPERRYTSADEMAADLKRYESGQPVIARPRHHALPRRQVRAAPFAWRWPRPWRWSRCLPR